MDVNKLKVFLSVVDAGSINKAADKLGYTQAGISYIINSIEEELGMSLLERSFNGVRLSVAGKSVISELKRVVNSYNSFEGVVSAQKNNLHKTLHVAAIDTVTARWFSDAFELFTDINTETTVDVLDGDPFEINEWVENGTVDIGITELDWAIESNLWIHLLNDPYRAIFPAGTNAPDPCPLSFFEGRRFFVADFGRERTVPSMLQTNKIEVDALNDKIGNLTILKAIAAGRGCTLMSSLEIDMCPRHRLNEFKNLEIVKVEGAPHRDLGFVLKGENNDYELIKCFISCFQKAIKNDKDWSAYIDPERELMRNNKPISIR